MSLSPSPSPSPSDFNNMISTLISYYNSQTTAHAGYTIALAVGVAAILYQLKLTTFFGYRFRRRMFFFYVPLSVLFGAIIFVILRIVFWAWMSSEVLKVSSNLVQNSTTPFNTIQVYLIGNYTAIKGWSNIAFSLYQENYVYPVLICILVVLFYVWLFDSWYVYFYNKNPLVTWKSVDMKNVRKCYIYAGHIVTFLLFILLLIVIVHPLWIINI